MLETLYIDESRSIVGSVRDSKCSAGRNALKFPARLLAPSAEESGSDGQISAWGTFCFLERALMHSKSG